MFGNAKFLRTFLGQNLHFQGFSHLIMNFTKIDINTHQGFENPHVLVFLAKDAKIKTRGMRNSLSTRIFLLEIPSLEGLKKPTNFHFQLVKRILGYIQLTMKFCS